MLHLYKRSTYLIVNGEPHTKLQYNVTILRDDTEPDGEFLIKDATWQEMFKRAQNDGSKWMYADQTFWKKIPYLVPSAIYWDDPMPKFFEDDTTRFSVVHTYVLDKHYSMQDIMKVSNADLAIQWFKERGMAVCPLQ